MNVFDRVWCEQNHRDIVLEKPNTWRFVVGGLAADLWHLLLCDCRVTSVRKLWCLCQLYARIIDCVLSLPQLPFMSIFYIPTASTRLYLIVYLVTVLLWMVKWQFIFIYWF